MTGIKHKDIGQVLTEAEWEALDSHELESGDSFPGTPSEKDRYYRNDLHQWYIHNGTEWKPLGGTDISDADAAVGEVKSGKTFYAGAEPKKTGTMPTVAIVAANDNYPAGYHVGNGGGLDAIDADLAPTNIIEGKTIFGKVGTYISYVINDTIFISYDAEGTNGTVSWTKVREWLIGSHLKSENIRTYFEMKTSDAGDAVEGRIYKGDAGFGTQRNTTSTTYQTYSEDLSFTGGNRLSLRVKNTGPAYATVYYRYMRLKGTIYPTTLYGFRRLYPPL